MSLVLSMGFVSCDDDDDDNGPGTEKSEIVDAAIDITISTSADLRKVADITAYYTNLSGEQVDISDDVAIAATHKEGDVKKVKDLQLPMELDFVMEINLKEGVEDGDYKFVYDINHSLKLLDAEGKTKSVGSSTPYREFTPDLSKFKGQTITSKLILKKDSEGNYVVEKP